MTAIEIVAILTPFQDYLVQLMRAEAACQPEYEYTYSVHLSYTFLTLKILRGAKDDAGKTLYIHLVFRIENNQILFSEIFHADGIDTQELTDSIQLNKKLHESPFEVPSKYSTDLTDEIVTYLSIADRISQHAVNMNAGDSYWPGNYSKIKITSDIITLEQVNHMNSRSIDHKDNYSLRDLVFQIPLQSTVTFKQSFDDVLLGKMLISFSDRSSLNHRDTGDAIQKQVKIIMSKLNNYGL